MSQTTQTLVSVIIPCYNQGKYIIECIQSVIAQTYKNWECIIIDDGSTDNTQILVRNFIEKNTHFQYIYQKNLGVSQARNNAIKLSSGRYILPLDGDDRIGNTYIEKAVTILEKTPEIKLVYCNALLFGNRNGDWHLPDYSFELLLKQNVFFCSALFRRSDFDLSNGYDTEMKVGLEDWEFWITLLKHGGKVYKLNETLFFYRIVTNSRNSSFNENKEREIRRYVYEKHKNLYEKNLNFSDMIYDNHLLKNQNEMLINSMNYRLGKMILFPVKFLMQLFQKNK